MKTLLWILPCLFLAGFTRIQNRAEVFVGDRVFFTDADCYSRMTRVRMVMENGWGPVRHHGFENFPAGIDSHATAPLDYVIAGCGRLLGLFGFGLGWESVEWAGAYLGPFLGVLTVLFLWIFAVCSGVRCGWTGAFFFAVSPVLVHGTVLGRPDHQALLILLSVVALGAELMLARKVQRSRQWALLGGLAFGMALWVSLYEPLILLVLVALAWGVGAPSRLLSRERLWWVGGFSVVLVCAVSVEGLGIFGVDQIRNARENWAYLARWGGTIGELAGVGWRQVAGWLGWALVGGPVLCVLRRRERGVWGVAWVLAVLVGLTLWQARWGYFLAAAWALVLPDVLAPLRRRWIVCLVFLISLWPVAWEWDARIDPDGAQARVRVERLRESFLLREMAGIVREQGGGVFLAPWWHSPAFAYWSGASGVAGSSHESIGGIVDSCRFYLGGAGRGDSERVLRERRVCWVLADDPDRVAQSAATILNEPVPQRSMAFRLTRESGGGSGCRLRAQNDFFKLFAVEAGRMVE